jgi:uncharacterized membrane protein
VVAERPWLITALVLAAAVHLVAVLMMPRLAQKDAFLRLAAVGPINTFHPLPRALPGTELTPFNDPATAMGVCRYDLAAGPLHVRAKLIGDGFVSLSFHARHDKIFYALTDKAAQHQDFDIYVVTADQLAAMQAKDVPDEPPKALRVLAQERRGFVFARALSPLPSAYEAAAEQIAAIHCDIEPLSTQ